MLTFNKLVFLNKIILNNFLCYFENTYIKNLKYNKNLDNLNNNNEILFNFIIINYIHYKIENYVKYIYILCPIVSIIVFLSGFKQLINIIY